MVMYMCKWCHPHVQMMVYVSVGFIARLLQYNHTITVLQRLYTTPIYSLINSSMHDA